ncbi:MAG: phage tail tape measure protein, partial [Ruminococcus sp.]|nr:phage tail tape measure protein [Ruminococcus sp.]
MATENITTKYKLDISEFKAGITEANKQIKLANAEFKAATAGMDDWSKSSDGLQAKIKQLNSTLDAQKSKLVAYRGQLEASENAYAENAKRAEELKKQLADLAVKGIEKTSAEYKQYEKQLNSVEREMTANRNAADNLRVTILNQEAAVASTEREIGNYSDELKNLDKNSEQAGEGLDKLAKRITTGVAVAITALGAAAVATGKKLWDMANETAKAGDEIDKQSQKLGVSAENYQKLSYAMERCGADVEDFRKGATNISKTLAEVQDGADEAETAIGQLGVSLKNTDGTMRSTEDVLLDTIAALADMDDETERNAAANKIFGKSYQELAPLLNSGADGIRDLMDEAEEYGMVMSDDAVKASAAFEDSLTKLKGTLGGIKNNLGAALLTPLTTLVDGFSDLAAGVDGSEQKISEGITGIVDTITKIV